MSLGLGLDLRMASSSEASGGTVTGPEANGDFCALMADAGSIKALVESADGTVVTSPRDSTRTIVNSDGYVEIINAYEIPYQLGRRVGNLTDGTQVTQNVTVISGHLYHVTIGAGSAMGATVVCSNAFTGTLTGTAANRIGWNSGVAKTAVSATLVLTVTGTITELFVEDVTGKAVQDAPSEYVSAGVLADPWHGAGVDGIKYFTTTAHNNSVDVNGVVTAGTASGSTDWYYNPEPAATNSEEDSNDLSQWEVTGATLSRDSVDLFGVPNNAYTVTDDSGNIEFLRSSFSVTADEDEYSYKLRVLKDADQTRYVGITFTLGSLIASYHLNTETGAITAEDITTAVSEASAVLSQDGLWWTCTVTATNENNDTARPYVIPSAGTVFGVRDNAATGSAVFDGAEFYKNTPHDVAKNLSYIPTTGAAITRSADDALEYTLAGNIVDAAGTLLIDVDLFADPATNQWIVDVNTTSPMLYQGTSDDAYAFDGSDASKVDLVPTTFPRRFRFAMTWETSGSIHMGRKDLTGAGAFVWDPTPANYDGSLDMLAAIRVAANLDQPIGLSNLRIWQTVKSQAWIEANY